MKGKLFLKITAIILGIIAVIAGGLVWFYGPTYGAIMGSPVYIMPPSAQKYGQVAIDIMDMAGVYAEGDTWNNAKQKAKEQLKTAKSYQDTHQIIKDALKVAGGKHSFLLDKNELKESNINPEMPTVAVENNIVKISLPAFTGEGEDMQKYVDTVANAIAENKDAKGFIVDLSNNNGGDMGPMISAVNALIPDGEIMRFDSRITGNTPVALQNGKVIGGGSQVTPASTTKINAPVAVIVSEKTASSGEMTMLAFKGLANAKSFGKATAGYTTINQEMKLYDGAAMYLTVGYSQDRKGNNYKDEPITPDVVTDDATTEAIKWIEEQK